MPPPAMRDHLIHANHQLSQPTDSATSNEVSALVKALNEKALAR
jgi:hypothetical protein